MLLRYNLFLFKRKHSRFTLGEFLFWQQHLSILDPSVGRTVTPFLLSPLPPKTDRPPMAQINLVLLLLPTPARSRQQRRRHQPSPRTSTPPPIPCLLFILFQFPTRDRTLCERGGERGVEREFCCHLLARTQAAKEGCEKKEEGAFLASFPCHLF